MSPSLASGNLRLTLYVDADGAAEVPKSDAWLRRVTRAALLAAGVTGSLEVAVLFAGDDALHRLNRQFRGVDKATDVLAFAQEEGRRGFQAPPGARRHLGDVAVSVERVRRQAIAHGHSFERELAYLLTHGVLHLAGYDHQTDPNQAAMRRVEESALAAVGLPREPRHEAAP